MDMNQSKIFEVIKEVVRISNALPKQPFDQNFETVVVDERLWMNIPEHLRHGLKRISKHVSIAQDKWNNFLIELDNICSEHKADFVTFMSNGVTVLQPSASLEKTPKTASQAQAQVQNFRVTVSSDGMAWFSDLGVEEKIYSRLNEVFEFAERSKMEKMSLKNNRIAKLPISIRKVKCLKQLDLGSNELKELPHEIEDLVALEELNLEGNAFVDFPCLITSVTGLKKLYME